VTPFSRNHSAPRTGMYDVNILHYIYVARDKFVLIDLPTNWLISLSIRNRFVAKFFPTLRRWSTFSVNISKQFSFKTDLKLIYFSHNKTFQPSNILAVLSNQWRYHLFARQTRGWARRWRVRAVVTLRYFFWSDYRSNVYILPKVTPSVTSYFSLKLDSSFA